MTLPLFAPEVAAEALHGSFCPKLCTFACPVATATGREDASPWSFHRTVSDLALSRLDVDAVAGEAVLDACTGCMGCQTACEYDQDVPSQVRAGREAAWVDAARPAAVVAAAAAIRAGKRPHPTAPEAVPSSRPEDSATVQLVAGCRDDSVDVAACVQLLTAAGHQVAVIAPNGCCGGVLRDLGQNADASVAEESLHETLDAQTPVVVLDPHCLPSVRTVGEAVHVLVALDTALTEGRLAMAAGAVSSAVTYHDPCLLARVEAVVDEPRRLLAAAGLMVREPERMGVDTHCSGAGMSMDLVDPEAAAQTAAVRAGQLGATAAPVITGCSGAQLQLQAAAVEVGSIYVTLAGRLVGSDTGGLAG